MATNQNKNKKFSFFWAIVFFLFLNSLSSSSGGLVFLFVIIFLCLFFYLAFFKAGGNSFDLSALINAVEEKNQGFTVEIKEDAVPSPRTRTRNSGVAFAPSRFSRERIVENEWKKSEKNEDSKEYWDNRLDQKISGAIIFDPQEQPQKRGRF